MVSGAFEERCASLAPGTARRAAIALGLIVGTAALTTLLRDPAPVIAGLLLIPFTLVLGLELWVHGDDYVVIQARAISGLLGEGAGSVIWRFGALLYRFIACTLMLTTAILLALLISGQSPREWVADA